MSEVKGYVAALANEQLIVDDYGSVLLFKTRDDALRYGDKALPVRLARIPKVQS